MALDLSRLTPEEQATAIYIGYYNRAADPIGFDFWLDAVNNPDVSLAQIGDLFAPQVETLAAYPFLGNPTAAEADAFVSEVYLNLFNRAPDQAGLDFYSDALEAAINGTSTYSIGQIILDIIGGAQDSAAGNDRATILNKIEAALAWTDAADAANIDYQFGSPAEQSAKDVVDAVDDTQASVDQAKADANAFFGVSTVLTAGNDTVTGNVIEAPREFTPGGNDQVNTLDDDDVLTGQGTNPTLNFTYVDDADIGATIITPTMNGIETINVSVQGNAPKSLDLQDSTGVDAINVSRVNASNLFQALNIAETVSDFSVNNSINNLAAVNFAHVNGALAGSADETNLTLNGAQLAALNVDNTVFGFFGGVVTAPTEGYETINVTSTGNANAVNVLGIYGNETLNIDGATDLRLGAIGTAAGAVSGNVEAQNFQAGLNGVFGFIDTVDASAMTGDLTYHIGTEINAASSKNSGAPIQMAITGGEGDDTFVLTTGAVVGGASNNTDVIDGGAGADTVVMTGNSVINAASAPNIRNVEALEIRTGHDADLLLDTVTIDADAFDALGSIFVRNEGQALGTTGGEFATVNLTDLTAAQATNITVQHGTTANNALASTFVNVDLKAPGATDTVAITLENGLNTDVRSNLTLNAASANTGGLTAAQTNVENITINDSDTESNTVLLGNMNGASLTAVVGANAVGHTGTITLTGGTAGTFMNLDATANAYRYDLTGAAADGGTSITGTAGNRSDVGGGVADRFIGSKFDATAYVGNTITRVADSSASVLGGQELLGGSGNDTFIFDQVDLAAANHSKAGLTINDTVNGGEGTDLLGIDGNGAAVTLGASEWTNVSNMEIIRLIGNGVADNNALGATNAYNLTLTNELLAANGMANGAGRQIRIVNDNDGANDVVANGAAGLDDSGANTAVFGLTGVEAGVTIDLRALTAANSINYNGEEGASSTADRFVFADANLNASSVIDGGRTYGAANSTTNTANNDVLEARNASVVSLGDLAGISNVGRIEFTNDTATIQASQLTLDTTTVDRMVNDGQAASATNGSEVISVTAVDNAVLGAATTQLNMNGSLMGQFTGASVLLGRDLNHTVSTGAANDVVTVLGNYNAADATAKALAGVNINGFNLAALQNGVSQATGLATNLVLDTGAGVDVLQLFGGVDLTGATLANVEGIAAASNITLTLAQFNALQSFELMGNGGHTITIVGSAGAVIDLAKFVDNTVGDINVVTDATATFAGTLADDGTGANTVNGQNQGGGNNGGGNMGFTTVDLSGQTAVTAQAGVAEAFVLEFNSGSGAALSGDAVVAITGFDPSEDKLVFDDANATPQASAVFLNGNGGAVVAADPFANSTAVSFQDDNPSDNSPAAQLTLLGIQDATLGGATPFFEVV